MQQTNAELAAFLTENGLVVEGDEKQADLREAAKYMREYLREGGSVCQNSTQTDSG